jgi:hypothetical protein
LSGPIEQRFPESDVANAGRGRVVERARSIEGKGEFAQLFGPVRRGRTFEAMRLDNARDSDDFHQYHLDEEQKRKNRWREKLKRNH